MNELSDVAWPRLWSGYEGITTYTEGINAQKYADTGEQWCTFQNFSGKEIASISMAIEAGTECGSIDLSIQDFDGTSIVLQEGGMPDGVAITNSLISGVTGIGGSTEWVTFTYTGTGPTPVGMYAIVVDPTASAGAYSFRPRYSGDWINGANWETNMTARQIGREWIHDGVDWDNDCTVGPVPLVITYKDGTYASTMNNPPFSTLDVTFNTNLGGGKSGSDVCSGVIFKAPYDLTLDSIGMKISTVDPYQGYEIVLIESATDTVLYRRVSMAWVYGNSNGLGHFGMDGITLSAGSYYRIYAVNPVGDLKDVAAESLTVPNTAYLAQMGIEVGDFRHCYADDPPSEGGTGTWTDSADTEIGIVQLRAKMDISSLSSGGSAVTSIRFNRAGQSGGTAF